MRVLHVTTVRWRAEDGIARAAAAIAARVDAESHLVTTTPAGRAAARAFLGTHLVGSQPGRLPWSRGFGELVDRLRPELVHVHGGLLAPAIASSPALDGIPVVASVYHAPEVPPWSRPLPYVRRLAAQRRSSVGTSRAAVIRLGGVRAARTLLRNGRLAAVTTPLPWVAEALAGVGGVVEVVRGAACVSGAGAAAWSSTPRIVFAGKAERARGVDVLLAALPGVRHRLPNVRLRLCLMPGGDARMLARAARLDGVDATIGPVDLDAELAANQVAAFPFRWSATMTPPLAAAEAMAAGLPLVASDVPCLADLAGPSSGAVLVPADDPAALADGLIAVLSDPVAWAVRSSRARAAIASRWCWDDAAARIDDIYRTVLHRSAPVLEEVGA